MSEKPVQKYTNENNISLLMAVFLADERYIQDSRPNTISVTTLMKSIRQIVLGTRLTDSESLSDVSDMVANRLGTAIHESIEKAWKKNYRDSLTALGFPQKMISQININPSEPNRQQGIDLYWEVRGEKQVGDMIVVGTTDAILDGAPRDIKTTKVWYYTSGSNSDKHLLQLSLYRWLNQDKINSDIGYIEYLFTDWSAAQAGYDQNYPKLPVLTQPFELHSIDRMQAYVATKLDALKTYFNTDESELPLCSDDDLWISPPEYKYYSKPDAQRATKNFKQDKAAAYTHLSQKGKGEVREIKGKAKACNYCNARPICSQYSSLVAQDLI